MASKAGVASLGPYILRIQSGRLIAANDVASEIINLALMPEGTLRSVTGPASLVDNSFSYGSGLQDSFMERERGSDIPRPLSTKLYANMSVGPIIKYAEPMHGIYHALLDRGQRDVLLLHTGPEIWEFTGWNQGWKKLVAEIKPKGGVSAELPNDTQPQYPTQFENTGRGIVIVPQGSRAYYYDGYTVAPLGFSEVPGPPQPKGPANSRVESTARGVGMNDIGYAHDGSPFDFRRSNYNAGMTNGFGIGRVGTTSELTFDASVFDSTGDNSEAYNAGWIQRGEYRCKSQFVDYFGNLSAMSAESSPVEIAFQPSLLPDAAGGAGAYDVVNVDLMRKQIAWTNISTGPDHCVGRNLYRTKDMIGSGDTKFYRHTQNTQGLLSDFATLPDNVSVIYPDNIPDAFLSREAQEIVPVPIFKLCRLAFGRLWITGINNQPGMVRPSLPGRYGTFAANAEIFPDPSGGEITGLARANQGLLAFTRTGTFIITRSDDGKGFRSSTISSTVGCEAPSSIATLDDGRTVWLGRDGFYAFDGSTIASISPDLRVFFKQISKPRMKQAVACYDVIRQEYRCWVSINAETQNSTCLIYDGDGWRKRTDVKAASVCLTQDHRKYMVTAGEVAGDNSHHGVYVLDHAVSPSDSMLNAIVDSREFTLETAWMQANQSLVRSTTKVVNLWLRETENATVTVDVFRDWRNTSIETATAKKYSGADTPNFYSSTPLGTKNAKFVKRRPYWTRVQVYVSSSETFKFRIKGTGDWEFIGLQVETSPRNFGGAQVPP